MHFHEFNLNLHIKKNEGDYLKHLPFESIFDLKEVNSFWYPEERHFFKCYHNSEGDVYFIGLDCSDKYNYENRIFHTHFKHVEVVSILKMKLENAYKRLLYNITGTYLGIGKDTFGITRIL